MQHRDYESFSKMAVELSWDSVERAALAQQ